MTRKPHREPTLPQLSHRVPVGIAVAAVARLEHSANLPGSSVEAGGFGSRDASRSAVRVLAQDTADAKRAFPCPAQLPSGLSSDRRNVAGGPRWVGTKSSVAILLVLDRFDAQLLAERFDLEED